MQRGSLTKYDVVCLWHFDLVDTGLNSQCPTVAEDLGFDPVDRGRKYEFNYFEFELQIKFFQEKSNGIVFSDHFSQIP